MHCRAQHRCGAQVTPTQVQLAPHLLFPGLGFPVSRIKPGSCQQHTPPEKKKRKKKEEKSKRPTPPLWRTGTVMVGMLAQRRCAAPRTRSRADVVESCAVLPNELRLDGGRETGIGFRNIQKNIVTKLPAADRKVDFWAEAAGVNLTLMTQPTIPGVKRTSPLMRRSSDARKEKKSIAGRCAANLARVRSKQPPS